MITYLKMKKCVGMHNNAMSHTANNSMNGLAEVFGERVIGQGLWPDSSPDLNRNFCLLGTLKDKVWVNFPHSPQKLKNICFSCSAKRAACRYTVRDPDS
jgi:hypothetical protein